MPYLDFLIYISSNILKIIHSSILMSPLWRGIFTISAGTVFAQLITIIASPLLTRLYTPYDFGIMALFSAVLSILIVIGSLRYEFAIPLPQKDSDAAQITLLCIGLLIGISVFSLIFMFFFSQNIISFFKLEMISQYLWLLPIGLIGAGIYNIFNYWAIRKRDYSRITYTKINQSLAGSISKITMGFYHFGPLGLIIGEILSQTTGIVTFLRSIWIKDKENFKHLSFPGIEDVVKKYSRFPLFSLPSSIVNSITMQLPVFMLSHFYGFQVVGLYSLSYMVLVFPASFISSAMAQVFLGELSILLHEKPNKIKNFYNLTIKNLFFIGLPLFLILAIITPLGFPLIFGDIWKDAGWYCIPLTMVAGSSFIVSSTSNLATYGYNHWQLGWDLFRFTIIVFVFYFAAYFHFSILIALSIYGLMMIATYVILYYLNLKAIERISVMY